MAVLLIGGTSETGKTTLAKHLSTTLRAPVLDLDAYRARLASHATQETLPDLYQRVELGEAILDLPTARQLDLKLRIAREVCLSLENQIRDQLNIHTTLVIEGDDVLPELADRFPSASFRALFILPGGEQEIARREAIRHPVLARADSDRRRSRTRVTWSYAEWLRGEATRRGLPVLEAAMSGTLIAAAERALGLEDR